MQSRRTRSGGKRTLRSFTIAVSAAALLAGTITTGQAAAAAPGASSGGKTEPVIVLLRDQLAKTPATGARSSNRRAAATSAQNTVLDKLSGPKPKHVKHFALGNAFATTVTTAQAAALADDPAVATVTRDAKVGKHQRDREQQGGSAPHGRTRTKPGTANDKGAVCPSDPDKPIVEPEALNSINAPTKSGGSAQRRNAARQASARTGGTSGHATGKGVKVGFLADNMDPNYRDFVRPDGSKVFSDYQDFSGDGPDTKDSGAEAFGDASSIAAQGRVVHDLSKVVNERHKLPKGCNVVVRGVSPGARLVGLNVFGGASTDSAILQAIDYAVTKDHVDVLNESLGSNPYPDAGTRNMVKVFNDNAVKAGTSVTASSGDAGITGTIGSPAADDPTLLFLSSTDGGLLS